MNINRKPRIPGKKLDIRKKDMRSVDMSLKDHARDQLKEHIRRSSQNEELSLPEKRSPTSTKLESLRKMTIDQLSLYCNQQGITSSDNMSHSHLLFEVVKHKCGDPTQIVVSSGTLETLPDGFGFLRSSSRSYLPSREDIYISPSQIRRYGLRKGDEISGQIHMPREKEKYFALQKIDLVSGMPPESSRERVTFDSLTPIHPNHRILMEGDKDNFSTRTLDLISPIGKGQRALIVAPPKAGKTMLLQKISNAISTNCKEAKLMVLLIDERPEEVTEMERMVKGEVLSSTFDEPPERHCQVAEICLEKVKRMVEMRQDVVILLDSLTRLARAYNSVQPHSGRILSGGVDANALHKPKRFFGAARNIEEGGSLTIIATAMIETGSKMDEVIYEEFKGTGNMELVLDRKLADRRIYPAIDVVKSGTRKEDLLYHPEEMEKIYLLRKCIAELSSIDAMNLLINRLKNTSNNAEFLISMKE